MIDLKCPECGCTIPPDAARCPNFGHKYDEIVVKEPTKSNGNDITVAMLAMQLSARYTERFTSEPA